MARTRADASPATTAPERAAGAGAQSASSPWWRTALIIFTLFAVMGVVPLALGGETLGYWRLPAAGPNFTALFGSTRYDAPLTHTTPVVTNATLQIRQRPGAGAVIATLEPGYGANLTQYATLGDVRWAKITWGGPTTRAGGSGWTLASGLIGGQQAASAREIGDLGALSPGLGQEAAALGPRLSAEVYFPASGATYRSAASAALQPLGKQIAPIVLTAYYAKGLNAAQPAPSAGPSQAASDLAAGNEQALLFNYRLVGDAAGLTDYLTQAHVLSPAAPDFHFVAQQPDQAQGSTQGLALFYISLLQGSLVNSGDQAQISGLLAQANNAQALALTPTGALGSGPLIVTSMPAGGGALITAAGALTSASATQVIVVASVQADSAPTAQKDLRGFFDQLTAVLSA